MDRIKIDKKINRAKSAIQDTAINCSQITRFHALCHFPDRLATQRAVKTLTHILKNSEAPHK